MEFFPCLLVSHKGSTAFVHCGGGMSTTRLGARVVGGFGGRDLRIGAIPSRGPRGERTGRQQKFWAT